MKAVTKILAGSVAAVALFSAAPVAAQYYPGSPYGGYGGGNVVGQVISQVLGGGYGGGYGGYGYGGNGYGANSQAVVGQCVAAVQARLNGGYGAGGYSPYGYNNGYGYNQGYGGPGSPYGYNNAYGSPYGMNGYGGGRVLGISRVEPRSGGGLTIRGVASSGRNAGYAYGGGYGGAYGGQSPVDLTFRCKTDYRGMITDIDVNRAQSNYGYGGYTPYNNYDYSQYGYRRY